MRKLQSSADPIVPQAGSATHQHLLAVLATELPRFASHSTIRILDAGCGDGKLLSYLTSVLPQLLTGGKVELYGFDVTDHGLQPQQFLQEAVRLLANRHPETCWEARIHAIGSEDA